MKGHWHQTEKRAVVSFGDDPAEWAVYDMGAMFEVSSLTGAPFNDWIRVKAVDDAIVVCDRPIGEGWYRIEQPAWLKVRHG